MENQSSPPANQVMALPVAAADRIRTIDMIRGVALLGILLMNIPFFGIDSSVFSTVLKGDKSNWDYRTMAVVYSLFDGTMRGLFSMLFGAGMILFTRKKEDLPGQAGMADYYYRRLLWLVVFGLFNAYVLLWPGDILFFYGLGGMLLFSFRKSEPSLLIALAVLSMVIIFGKGMLQWKDLREKRSTYLAAMVAEKENKPLTEAQQGAKAEWIEFEKSQRPDTARTNRNLRKMDGSYATIFNYFIPLNTNIEIWGIYHGVWDILSMMLLGMALFKLGFFSNRSRGSTYVMGLLIGYGIGIPVGWSFFEGQVSWTTNASGYVDAWRVPHWAIYDVRRLLLCIGHASLIMLVYRSKVAPWLMRWLANVGQMAFTNYLMQSIICSLIFYGYGWGYYNQLRFHQLYYVVAGVWIFQMIFSTVWLRYFRFGPFEWLWRSLTYWKKQRMQ